METIRRSFDSISTPRRRSNSVSHSSPPSIYPIPNVPEDTIPVIPPPRPATSASQRPPYLQRAYVVVGSTQSSVAILHVPRPHTSNLVRGPTNNTKSAPPSIFHRETSQSTRPPKPLQRTRSSGSLEREYLEKYLQGTKTVEEYRREMELELIRRNRERKREKESGWGRVVGKMKKKLLSDDCEGVRVVYMTAKEAAEREWQIQSQFKSKALMRV